MLEKEKKTSAGMMTSLGLPVLTYKKKLSITFTSNIPSNYNMDTAKFFSDGIWVQTNLKFWVYEVKDGMVTKRNMAFYDYPELQLDHGKVSWELGSFSAMPETLQQLTGETYFNLKMEPPGKEAYLYEDGKTIVTIPKSGIGIESIHWVPPEVFTSILDSRENWDQASTFYPVSSQQGKILFLSGAPGAGKTTSAYMLAKNHGYVYYEGDCFTHMANPYVPLDVDNHQPLQYYMQSPIKNYPIGNVNFSKLLFILYARWRFTIN